LKKNTRQKKKKIDEKTDHNLKTKENKRTWRENSNKIGIKTDTQIATTASEKPPSRTAAVMKKTTRTPTIRVANFRVSGISLKSLSCNDTYKQNQSIFSACKGGSFFFRVNMLSCTLLQGKPKTPESESLRNSSMDFCVYVFKEKVTTIYVYLF
jgi:hypothetical protein